jgi:glutamate racemase
VADNRTIGLFDSGVGGLTVLRAVRRLLPDEHLIYLGDTARVPYGNKGPETIERYSLTIARTLQERGCKAIVIACNTASAIALRRLQQTWIPGLRERLGRPVNVLGIIVPTIEAATGLPWSFEAERPQEGEKIQAVDITGVFCTAATAISRVFEIEIDKRREDIAVFCEPCPGLAGLIELGAPVEELTVVVKDHVDALRRRIGRHPDKAILGCTHYEIIAELFAEALPAGTVLIEQPTAVADALDRYFARHPEYALGDGGRRDFLTTGQAGPQSDLIARFWGAPLTFDQA